MIEECFTGIQEPDSPLQPNNTCLKPSYHHIFSSFLLYTTDFTNYWTLSFLGPIPSYLFLHKLLIWDLLLTDIFSHFYIRLILFLFLIEIAIHILCYSYKRKTLSFQSLFPKLNFRVNRFSWFPNQHYIMCRIMLYFLKYVQTKTIS